MDKRRGRLSRISFAKFLSHATEAFRRRTLLCFRTFLVSKNVRDERMEGITIFHRNCFVPQYRKTSQRNLSVLCFRNFPIAKNFSDKKEWAGVSRFSVEKFLSHSAETFRRGTFQCVTNFGYRKKLGQERGGYHDFLSNLFCLTVANHFVGKLFSVSLISGFEKCYGQKAEGG